MISRTLAAFPLLGILFLTSSSAHAASVTVLGTADIYAAGTQSGVADGGYYGTVPGSISTVGDASFTFSVAAGATVTLNGGGNYNDADGVGGAAGTSSNTGSGSISGITAPNDGYLVGVFLAAGGPSGSAPAALDYTTTNFTTSSPLIDQVFFIGDGLTGDGSGSVQTFLVPTGATALYLGISDASGYNGSPSSYSDNAGSFAVTTNATALATSPTVGATPEPSSLILLGTGAVSVFAAARRRLAAR